MMGKSRKNWALYGHAAEILLWPKKMRQRTARTWCRHVISQACTRLCLACMPVSIFLVRLVPPRIALLTVFQWWITVCCLKNCKCCVIFLPVDFKLPPCSHGHRSDSRHTVGLNNNKNGEELYAQLPAPVCICILHVCFFVKEKERSKAKKRTKEEEREKEGMLSWWEAELEKKSWRICLRCYHPWLSFLLGAHCHRFKFGMRLFLSKFTCTAWCCEIGFLTSPDAWNSGEFSNVKEPWISLHQTVCSQYHWFPLSGTTEKCISPSTIGRYLIISAHEKALNGVFGGGASRTKC